MRRRRPGKPDERQPKVLNAADLGYERVKLYGLREITVGVQSVCSQNVFLIVRRREHNDRDRAQERICFEVSQDLPAILLRKIQIEENNVGGDCISESSLLPKELQADYTILGNMDVMP